MRGFARVSAAVPALRVGDVDENVERTFALWQRSDAQGDALVVFPELGLTGYTIRDLFHDTRLLEAARQGLLRLAAMGRGLRPLALVGLPLRVGSALFNVAAAIQGGRVLALVPKTHLPNYREFEEARWFRSGAEIPAGSTVCLGDDEVPFGTDVLLQADAAPDLLIGVEMCEDFWVQVPPSAYQVSAGATIVCNLSASNFTVGKAELRRLLAASMSDRGKCAYVYVAAGPGESSTDLAFDADAFVCENGREVASSRRFHRGEQIVTFDVDLELLMRERIVHTTFGDCAVGHQRSFRRVPFEARADVSDPLRRSVDRHPFVPRDPTTLGRRCWEVFEIQAHALATRMSAVGAPKLVLGVSGGLDSTHAALVCTQALELSGQPHDDLVCVTMPGLGTTTETRGNAEQLARCLGARLEVVDIREASRLLLTMVGHPAVDGVTSLEGLVETLRARPELGDITFENVQARLRTLVLMTMANRLGGIVVGTGDLSEKALGWSTYAGDHISMYDVNAGVPKTLVQSVIRWVADERAMQWSQAHARELRDTLFAILDTPISPELLPPGEEGEIVQRTEDTLGPYELHDFFTYHFVRHGARPGRVLDLARVAFGGDYPLETLQHWLRVFVRRFFNQQFKRSCTADAPKVGQVALSPRGDWRMPSDARPETWLAEIDAYPGEHDRSSSTS
jgi:NAD+ synthase (glutamine-hydrolysing)